MLRKIDDFNDWALGKQDITLTIQGRTFGYDPRTGEVNERIKKGVSTMNADRLQLHHTLAADIRKIEEADEMRKADGAFTKIEAEIDTLTRIEKAGSPGTDLRAVTLKKDRLAVDLAFKKAFRSPIPMPG